MRADPNADDEGAALAPNALGAPKAEAPPPLKAPPPPKALGPAGDDDPKAPVPPAPKALGLGAPKVDVAAGEPKAEEEDTKADVEGAVGCLAL